MTNNKNITKSLLVGAFVLGSLGFSKNVEANAQTLLSEKQIQEIILKDNPNSKVIRLELEKEAGVLVYDVETFDGSTEKDYEAEIF